MAFKKGHKLNIGNKYALGAQHTEEWKENARKRMLGNTNGFVKGKPSPRRGKKANKPSWNKGLKMPKQSGKNHWHWSENRTPVLERQRLRSSVKWRAWRNKVFERDNYICQECEKSGIYLEPHHIIPIREDTSKVFDPNNGITLCRKCHQKTLRKESQFAEKYLSILKTKLREGREEDSKKFSPALAE